MRERGGQSFLRGAVLLTVALGAATVSATASPWNREDGSLFVASRIDYFRSSTPVSDYSRVDSDTYLEWGLAPRWMVGGKTAYGTAFIATADGTSTVAGFGESELFVQRQVQRAEHSATAVRVAGVRSGDQTDGARPGEQAGGFDADVRALHGRDVLLQPFKVFVAAEAGYRRRFSGAADQIRAEALVGLEFSLRFLVLIESQSILSLRNNEIGFDDFDLFKGQASVIWRATKRWALVAGARTEFAARNIEPGDAVTLGLWTEF